MSDRIYCYPHTNVLKNKLNIRDADKFLNAEIRFTSNRLFGLQKCPESGSFDLKHLQCIHRRIFQDLFDWAGKIRSVDIAKGSLFCPSWNIQGYAQDVFRDFYSSCMTAKDDKQQFVKTLAAHYADLNALHPFREGNGRSQREFTRELCMECGYIFDLTQTKHHEMLNASILSLDAGDNTGLEQIFNCAVVSVNEYKGLNEQLESKIMILSSDDIPVKSSSPSYSFL